MPIHTLLDHAQEQARSDAKIGTTGRGVGPTYMDKVGRYGLRVGDLYDPEPLLRERLTRLLDVKRLHIANCAPDVSMQTPADLLDWCEARAEKLRPYVTDTVALAHDALDSGKNILFEGAQGTLLDIDYGTYPFVTSSNATAGGACTGSGIGPTRIDRVIGVMKAYVTRVGEGPFPTELNDATGAHLLEVGREFGTTTGRPRRCGWFDAVIGRYAVRVNGLDGLAVTKLDVFDGLAELKICVAYAHRDTGERVVHFPSQVHALRQLTAVYEVWPGWEGSVKDARRFDELPEAARNYLNRIRELLGCPLSMVSVGPERHQTILLENPMAGGNRVIVGSGINHPV